MITVLFDDEINGQFSKIKFQYNLPYLIKAKLAQVFFVGYRSQHPSSFIASEDIQYVFENTHTQKRHLNFTI